MTAYPDEVLGPDDDDGTMVQSKESLAQAIVGARIVDVTDDTRADLDDETLSYWERNHDAASLIITLDNGKRVRLIGQSDCCAFTNLEGFLLHPDKVSHAITGVGTTEGYTKWHIFADAGDIMELDVGWSCGNPFYYGYGFSIDVEEFEEETT